MNTKLTHLTSSIFAVALSTITINSAQAAAALNNATLSKASNLLEEKEKIRKKKNRKKTKKKYAHKKHIKTCDTYSQKILYKKAEKYQADINELAQRYKVPAHLIMAVITVESCFRESVRSPRGAAGLMQLIPATASRFGTKDRYNPRANIKAGTRYLQFLLKRFNGNLKLVAAAYNAGEGAVTRHKGIPPYKETRAYVGKVLNAYHKLAKGAPKNKRHLIRKRKAQTTETLSSLPLQLAHHKRVQNLIDTGNLTFTAPEWKNRANSLTPKQGTSEGLFEYLL